MATATISTATTTGRSIPTVSMATTAVSIATTPPRSPRRPRQGPRRPPRRFPWQPAAASPTPRLPRQPRSPGAFRVSFPLRTNYMFARVRPSVRSPLGAVSVCLWLRPGRAPNLGTPFSYAAPGQPNELVLLAWGGRPLELLVDDQVPKIRGGIFW
uniref:Pentraxin (PTX) domain-containing protein n=1 Tax=Serinus canaria TaxID=9135 RepID=A0A8C9MXG9_SERCA